MDKHSTRKHIVLVGFMGTGKSTVSHLLAERLGCKAIDTDAELERREGRKIRDIFAEQGEAAFRKIETSVLGAVLSEKECHVIATGGGAVLAAENRELMSSHGLVVALKADPACIIERVGKDAARPLLQGNPEVWVPKLLEDRKHAYDFAHLAIETAPLTAEQVADQIWERWQQEAGN
ncbi:shikimate kinase [Paenibacillus sp. GCM10027626]|uniref:shikimate kinase n=1 Tax=Paenibacillus sp. GCM10027626 TaxID=3273411 RepID=UPI0036401316